VNKDKYKSGMFILIIEMRSLLLLLDGQTLWNSSDVFFINKMLATTEESEMNHIPNSIKKDTRFKV